MTTTTIELDLFQENIKHLSTNEIGNFIAITSRNRVIISGAETPLEPGVDILMARIIDEEKILMILERYNNHATKKRKMTPLFKNSGEILHFRENGF